MSEMLKEEQERRLEDLFSFHEVTAEQQAQIDKINEAAKEFARVVIRNTPQGEDQQESIRCIRLAKYFANGSIAIER